MLVKKCIRSLWINWMFCEHNCYIVLHLQKQSEVTIHINEPPTRFEIQLNFHKLFFPLKMNSALVSVIATHTQLLKFFIIISVALWTHDKNASTSAAIAQFSSIDFSSVIFIRTEKQRVDAQTLNIWRSLVERYGERVTMIRRNMVIIKERQKWNLKAEMSS